MDGKVIGSLREFTITSDVEKLVGVKGLPSKILNNRVTRNALRNLTKGVRRMIRLVEYGRGATVVQDICSKDDTVFFRLGR